MLSQFRCNGSDSYLSWIDNVLEINCEATDEFDYDYDIRICDTPDQVRNLIFEKNKINNKSRMGLDIVGIGLKKVEIKQMFMIFK